MQLFTPFTPGTPISPEQSAQVRHLAILGLRLSVISTFFGVTPEELNDSCGPEIAAAARHAKQAVLGSLYDMATSGKNISATIFWLRTFCPEIFPAPKTSKKSEPEPEFVPRPFKFEVYCNDGEPNFDY